MVRRAVIRQSPKEREFEPADILELFKFFRVVEGVGKRAVCEPAAWIVLASFGHIDQHYTYTLCPEYASTMWIL